MGLYHLTQDMEESAKATTNLLLMLDKDDKRVLGYQQFAKLILAIAATTNSTFDEVADDLTLALTSNNGEFDEDTLKVLTIADAEYAKVREKNKFLKKNTKAMDPFSYQRTVKLFDLWDRYVALEYLLRGDKNCCISKILHLFLSATEVAHWISKNYSPAFEDIRRQLLGNPVMPTLRKPHDNSWKVMWMATRNWTEKNSHTPWSNTQKHQEPIYTSSLISFALSRGWDKPTAARLLGEVSR